MSHEQQLDVVKPTTRVEFDLMMNGVKKSENAKQTKRKKKITL